MTLLRPLVLCAFALSLLVSSFGNPAIAQDREVPYWATLRFDTVNMRKGPSQDYPIDWVYKRKGLPVKVVRLREGWRLVQDPEGTQGWIAASQLSPKLGAMVVGEGNAPLREEATNSAGVRWRAEPGVVGELLRCRDRFCEIDVSGRSGWVSEERLWGVGEM